MKFADFKGRIDKSSMMTSVEMDEVLKVIERDESYQRGRKSTLKVGRQPQETPAKRLDD